MLIPVILTVLAVSVSGQVTICPEGWQQHEGNCYGMGEQPVPWIDAQGFCNQWGGKLAELNTISKNTFVQSLATLKNLGGVWIGGTDVFDEGNWMWVSTKEHILSNTDWHLHQPNDAGSHGEDCMYLDKGHHYKWADEDCNKHFYFVCEIRPSYVTGLWVTATKSTAASTTPAAMASTTTWPSAASSTTGPSLSNIPTTITEQM